MSRFYVVPGGVLLVLLSLSAPFGRAQEQTGPSPAEPPQDRPEKTEPSVTVFPHSETSRFWISGQANFIVQWHPAFRSPYRGPNSLRPEAEHAGSRVLTLFLGLEATHTTEILVDIESAGGGGIGDALGLAGFSNLDVVRNPTLGSTPYLARAMIRQVIPLSDRKVSSERGPLSLATSLPARRFEVRAGKFGVADFFDLNSAGSDSHLQFLNWTVDNNGGYDYAADTRGYTVGVILEYQEPLWGVRFGETLMPTVANGIDYEWNLAKARAENVEFELRKGFLPHRQGTIRLLTYVNHANMGDYREAIAQFESDKTPRPDITDHPFRTALKYGFGANLDQDLNSWITAYGRFGWNEGRHESYAYTEVNQAISGGLVAHGKPWHRRLDRGGFAVSVNALSGDHRRYLELGGLGFLLGDGKLTYGRERIVEGFYTIHFWRGVFGSFDIQHIDDPGYNRDRGPVLIPAFRLHLEL